MPPVLVFSEPTTLIDFTVRVEAEANLKKIIFMT